jgi:hypothetical protein
MYGIIEHKDIFAFAFCYLRMWMEWNRVHCYCGHLLAYQSWMTDGDDCGGIGGMMEWQRK